VKCYERVLAGGLRNAEVLVAKGLAHRHAGDVAAARACFERAVALDPGSSAAHANLGNLQFAAGDAPAAAASYARALELSPDNAQLRANGAAVCLAADRLDDARRLLCVDWPAHAPLPRVPLLALARALAGRRHDGAALEICARLLAVDPNDRDALNERGGLAYLRGEFATAREVFATAVDVHARDPVLRYHLGAALRVLGEEAAASAELTAGLRLLDEDVDVADGDAATLRQRLELEQAFVHLGAGRLAEGWALHPGRWYPHAESPATALAPWLWQGEDLAGRRLVIAREQGIGDEILFASMYAELQALTDRLVLQCSSRLAPAFARTFPRAELWTCAETPDAWRDLPPRLAPDDALCFAGDLPRWRRPVRDSFPRRPCLAPDAAAVAAWRARLDALGPGPKVGISWRGGTAANYGELRSLPLADFVRGWPANLVLVDLQYDEATPETAALAAAGGPAIASFAETRRDFDATINLVAALDLLVTVQTAVAHVGGALGVRTLVLVPQAPTTVRWLGDGAGQTPWYGSVELITQARAGDWLPVLARVVRQLKRLGRTPRRVATEQAG
jgi:tetratricopeptide (TPR) repeat protein